MSSSLSSRLGGRGSRAWGGGGAPQARRLVRRWKRPSRRTGYLLAAAAALLALCASSLWWAPILHVDTVDLQGASGSGKSRVLEAAGVHEGQPLIEVDPQAVAERIRSTGLVARVDVARRWPSAVAITVTPRVALFAVSAQAGAARLVDAQGVAFDDAPTKGLSVPVARLARPHDAGQLSSAAAAVAALSPEQRKELRSIDVAASGIITMQVGAVRVVWGDSRQGALKAEVVAGLQRQSKVVSVDVSAPLTPALKDAVAGG